MQGLFGSPLLECEFLPADKTFRGVGTDVTAIVVISTDDGFIIAADGRGRWSDSELTSTLKLPDDDNLQKIFHTKCGHNDILYAVVGWIRDPLGGYDLIKTMQEATGELRGRQFASLDDFIHAVIDPVSGAIRKAMETGHIPIPSDRNEALAGMHLASYFNDEPSLGFVQFWSDGRAFRTVQTPPREPRFYGSATILYILRTESDERFREYFHPSFRSLETQKTLIEAEALARAYIAACSNPIAEEIEPRCKGIGGRVHIARLSRDGFFWIDPPIAV